MNANDEYPFPHCNPQVLHEPGACYYCDTYAAPQQQMRLDSGTPFTPLEANGWSGNVAVKAGEKHSHLGATYTVGLEREAPRQPSLRSRLRAMLGR